MKFGVSLYSYQTALRDGHMDLEACLQAVRDLPGADGVEVLFRRRSVPQAAYKGLIDEHEAGRFQELMARYGLTPTCYDSIARNPAVDHREGIVRLTNPSQDVYREQLAQLKDEIDFASSLGFRDMRAPNVYGFYEEVIRDSLLYARDHAIRLCAEIHAPMTIDGDIIAPYLEMVDKTCPEAGGVIPDLGIFSRALPQPCVRAALQAGAPEALVQRIEEVYEARGDLAALEREVRAQSQEPHLLNLLRRAQFLTRDDPRKLIAIGPYIRHVHAKFYEVDPQGTEHGIDFAGALRALREAGFAGYLSSEYEGHAFHPEGDPDEVTQVRRQTAMTQRLLQQLEN